MQDGIRPEEGEITPLDVGEDAVPDRFPSPFDEIGPHPIAALAAATWQRELRSGWLAPGVALPASLAGPGGGKMLGVLVVRDAEGGTGFLRAFSGMLEGTWTLPGCAPPLFDPDARIAVEQPGEELVARLVARDLALSSSAELLEARRVLAAALARHEAENRDLRSRQVEAKVERRRRRHGADPDLRAELDRESAFARAERRRLRETHAVERALLGARLGALEARTAAATRLRGIVCRLLARRILDSYLVPNARRERVPLRSLFGAVDPPGGAGDCAAPKLLARAFALGLSPIALAEFWWGAPPAGGGRVEGGFHPSCRDKCGPLLPWMLGGLDVAEPRRFALATAAPDDGLVVLHEDERLVVVDKPCGLLSVPGRGADRKDSVLSRLRRRYPDAQGPLLVHRLDLETSGLLVAALDEEAFRLLQARFAARLVRKRYVAWLDGQPEGEAGVVDLALRGDPWDRPRQVVDPLHGREALTRWRVLERRGAVARVAFSPATGRTHQLRVHASHPLGLGAAIVGDRLYGRAPSALRGREDGLPGDRLLLHAESIELRHPSSGLDVRFVSPAPF